MPNASSKPRAKEKAHSKAVSPIIERKIPKRLSPSNRRVAISRDLNPL